MTKGRAERLANKKAKLYSRRTRLLERVRRIEKAGEARMQTILDNGRKRAEAYWLRTVDPKLRKLDNEVNIVERKIILIEEEQERND